MGTESAACYKMELERPGGRTREEVDLEGREKESLFKRVWFYRVSQKVTNRKKQ